MKRTRSHRNGEVRLDNTFSFHQYYYFLLRCNLFFLLIISFGKCSHCKIIDFQIIFSYIDNCNSSSIFWFFKNCKGCLSNETTVSLVPTLISWYLVIEYENFYLDKRAIFAIYNRAEEKDFTIESFLFLFSLQIYDWGSWSEIRSTRVVPCRSAFLFCFDVVIEDNEFKCCLLSFRPDIRSTRMGFLAEIRFDFIGKVSSVRSIWFIPSDDDNK